MKQRTSFILKGLISLVLSLVMLCGTAVTSLSAVTVDLAETGDVQQVTDLPLMDGDIVGSAASAYTIESSGSGWLIKKGTSYIRYNYGYNESASLSDATTFTAEKSNSSFVFKCTGRNDAVEYLTYNSNSKQCSFSENNLKTVSVFRNVVTYTVTFNANGGSGTMANQTITGAGNLNANAFTHSKYSFESWNTKADGTGEVYADGGIVNFKTDTILYAQWDSKKTFYFSNNKSWANVYAYMWKDGVDNSVKTAWPGDKLSEISKNAYGDGIFSVTVDLEKYDRLIFSDGKKYGEDNSARQTETISLTPNTLNGIYTGNDLSEDHVWNVSYYPYPVSYSKQIEKLNTSDPDDYNYRLHLTVDGGALHGETETTPGQSKKQKVALIIDATETMLSTSLSGSNAGENKFQTIQRLLKQSGGFLEKYLDGNNEVAVIFVGGVNGNQVSYTTCYNVGLNKTTDLTAARGNWSDQHYSQGISYTTAFLAAQDVFDPDETGEEYSIVFFAGNAPQSYLDINTKKTNNQVPSNEYGSRNLSDCKGFLDTHPNVTFYGVGVASQSGDIEHGSAELKELSEYSCGEYYNATTVDILTEQLVDIVERILPDKTTNLTVTDVLSDNVVLADQPNLSATLYTNPSNGVYQTQSTAITPTVSADGKTITYTNPGTITGPYKLEITFDIKTADGVFMDTAKYPGTGYPNTGDEDTDFGNNNTSSGQSGYYSNANATLSYTLNGSQSTMTFAKPVVQAPVGGKYIFKYKDRYNQTRTVTVPVTLNSSEKTGYSGNGNQAGVPTYIWNTDSQNLFDHNPLLTAALVVQGNAENWKNVDVYKNTIAWGIGDNGATHMEFDETAHTLTVTADVEPIKFTVNAYNGSTTLATVTDVPYGDVVTFHKQYEGAEGCHYVDVTIPDGFTYWSSDPNGNFLLTTNPTFGMVIRGNVNEPDSKVVNVYLQTKAIPATDPWKPEIEESKLTYSNDDETAEQKYYADYLANYFSVDGSVIQDKIASGETVKYGLLVVKSDFNLSELDQDKMISALNTMRSKNYESAYLNDNKTRVAYRYEYNDGARISNFNRTWYTITGSQATMGNKKLTAMAYVEVDGRIYYSAVDNKLATAASN